jgi:hypothetical protein
MFVLGRGAPADEQTKNPEPTHHMKKEILYVGLDVHAEPRPLAGAEMAQP